MFEIADGPNCEAAVAHGVNVLQTNGLALDIRRPTPIS